MTDISRRAFIETVAAGAAATGCGSALGAGDARDNGEVPEFFSDLLAKWHATMTIDKSEDNGPGRLSTVIRVYHKVLGKDAVSTFELVNGDRTQYLFDGELPVGDQEAICKMIDLRISTDIQAFKDDPELFAKWFLEDK